MILYMCWMTSQGAKTTSWGAYATYSRKKRQKKKALRRGAEQKANYIIPTRRRKVKMDYILLGVISDNGGGRTSPW